MQEAPTCERGVHHREGRAQHRLALLRHLSLHQLRHRTQQVMPPSQLQLSAFPPKRDPQQRPQQRRQLAVAVEHDAQLQDEVGASRLLLWVGARRLLLLIGAHRLLLRVGVRRLLLLLLLLWVGARYEAVSKRINYAWQLRVEVRQGGADARPADQLLWGADGRQRRERGRWGVDLLVVSLFACLTTQLHKLLGLMVPLQQLYVCPLTAIVSGMGSRAGDGHESPATHTLRSTQAASNVEVWWPAKTSRVTDASSPGCAMT